MFFNVGDLIRSKSTGRRAIVLSAHVPFKLRAYTVQWQNFSGTTHNGGIGTYQHSDIVNEWELLSSAIAYGYPSSTNVDSASFEEENTTFDSPQSVASCDAGFHTWKVYNSGWTELEYCEKCNKERKSQ